MSQSPPTASCHTVLIATSATQDLSALRQLLLRQGLQLRVVSTGDSVLGAASEGGVALVLLDVTLAGSASFELCQRLSRLPLPGTAATTAPTTATAMAAGAQAAPSTAPPTAQSSAPSAAKSAAPSPAQLPAQLPVFLLSASPGDDERRRALQAGAAGYVALPFAAADVAERILVQLGRLPATEHDTVPRLDDVEISYHTMLAGSPDAVLLLDLEQNRLIDVNRSARQLFGRADADLLHGSLLALCPPRQADGRSSADMLAGYLGQVAAGEIGVFEADFLHSSGQPLVCELRMMPLQVPGRRLLHMRLQDVTARRRADALRAGQNRLLEMVARGAPLQQTLGELMLLIEAQSDDVLCSVMLLDADGRTMHPGAGPSLPADYLAKLDGLAIGPGVGSCGTAMYRRETVIVSDIQSDPLWAPYRALAGAYGLRACWSIPILFDRDTVLGSFAMYYREVRSPSDAERELIGVATHLTGIAIARTRREEELERHRSHLEELVAARTAELQRAKEEAEMANDELSTALDNLSMTQEELVRRDKLAALGTLVAGVAHELNTPIGNSLVMASTMSERTGALRQHLEDGLRRSVLDTYLEQAAEADAVVLRNLKRAAGLVDSFKRIAVDAVGAQRRCFLLDQLVAELMAPLAVGARPLAVTVVQDIAPGLQLDSYPGPLGQALTHLFDNSVLHGMAGRAGGTVTVRARATAVGEIALSLADDGAGIADYALARIYDPFYTTRLGQGSSGLGLYITHNIVTGVLGGRIEATSSDAGTCFTLLLPPVAPR